MQNKGYDAERPAGARGGEAPARACGEAVSGGEGVVDRAAWAGYRRDVGGGDEGGRLWAAGADDDRGRRWAAGAGVARRVGERVRARSARGSGSSDGAGV